MGLSKQRWVFFPPLTDEIIQNTDLEDRLRRRLVAEDGDADLTEEGSDETLAFLLLRFWHRGFIREENLPNIFENAIAREISEKRKEDNQI